MINRLEEIVSFYNQEYFEEPQYSMTCNDEKAIIYGHEGDICHAFMLDVVALCYAYHLPFTIYAHDSAPYIEIQLL